MPSNPSAFALLEPAEGRDIGTGEVVTLAKSQPVQYSLFQHFLCDTAADAEKYSNTIELYDAVPKYFASQTLMAAQREGGKYLPILRRDFMHRGERYTVEITPARYVDRQGEEKEYYPGVQEELVEEALKKIACDRLNGIFLNGVAGVQFTMYELRQELKRRGHAMHLHALLRSLTICRRAQVAIRKQGGKGRQVYMESSIFPTLVIAGREDWCQDPKHTRCYVQFNPLITHSIQKLTYRQFNYETFMQLKHPLARWLCKRLSHNYTQAALLEPYGILLSTIVRDSCLANAKTMRHNAAHIRSVLEELHAHHVLLAFEATPTTGKRGRIEDVHYRLTPHPYFVDEVKKANRRHRNHTAQIDERRP
jgi:hypothetical protein